MFLWRSQHKWRDTTSQKKAADELESELDLISETSFLACLSQQFFQYIIVATFFSSNVLPEELERMVKDSAAKNKEAETISVRGMAESWKFPDLVNELQMWSFLRCKSFD